MTAKTKGSAGVDPGALTLEDIPELVDIKGAMAATHLSMRIIRGAIKRKELAAFIPGGRNVLRPGRGMGYRIRRQDLQRWFFGAMRGDA